MVEGYNIKKRWFVNPTTVTLQKQEEKKSTTTRDTRLAGRLRFYKSVGIVDVSPPWSEQAAKTTPTRTTTTAEKGDAGTIKSNDDESVVQSPISAGVDGTDSASGIKRLPGQKNSEELALMLTPRRPYSDSTDETSDSTSNDKVEWYGVTLDGRAIQTPMGQKLAVPSKTLAYAIAAEWDAQSKFLQPANMPLMTLTCTTLDQAGHHPDVYREQSLNFLPTDTVSYATTRTTIISQFSLSLSLFFWRGQNINQFQNKTS